MKTTINEQTSLQFAFQANFCRSIFIGNLHKYCDEWRKNRLANKNNREYAWKVAQEIREKEERGEDPASFTHDYRQLLNRSIVAFACSQNTSLTQIELDGLNFFDAKVGTAKDLMERKNHDYGEAWRKMRVSSFTDLILMKLLRIEQVESHGGKTIISEGVDANYYDIINYAIFALILLSERFPD